MMNESHSSELLIISRVHLQFPLLVVRIVLDNQDVLILRDHLRQHTVDDLG